MKLSNNIKKYRKKIGLTQAELADLVQVSRKTINTVENGLFVPSTVLSLSIAKILNQRFEEIFSLEI
ncbi:MAG: transcriptional regulator [Rhodospirillaceae bacterium]|nr:transcriptional regulator [Rhodospirillaceae bacterium]|tara:strand:- start:518 stop:718 length:201 start_codon:yes stop_codon:yes gene_type:complete